MNRLLFAASITGALSVAMGAFGAHGLADQLSIEANGWWETATLYALVHSVAALSLALHAATAQKALPRRAGWAFIIGILFFSGSLYAMALGSPRWFGAITPIGGLGFLCGWIILAIYSLGKKQND